MSSLPSHSLVLPFLFCFPFPLPFFSSSSFPPFCPLIMDAADVPHAALKVSIDARKRERDDILAMQHEDDGEGDREGKRKEVEKSAAARNVSVLILDPDIV